MKIGFAGTCVLTGVVLLTAVAPRAATALEITPAVQAELDRLKQTAAKWAADPAVVSAVKAQNDKGPLAGMDNATWKAIRRSDPAVQGFVQSPAGQFIRAQIQASGGGLDKAFLNGAQGEKVAFAEKTISYLHKGQEKFDAPMSTGKPWQMSKPWFDESLQGYAIQIAVPVLDGGKPIGVLVASVPVLHLEKVAKK
jgi:hypothetical protein